MKRIHHSRIWGVVYGRLPQAVQAGREFVECSKSHGAQYTLWLGFGGPAPRLRASWLYDSLGAFHEHASKLMADNAYYALLEKHAGNWAPGSLVDEIWSLTHPGAQVDSGSVSHIRTMGVLPGREASAASAVREFVAYHKAAGSSYQGFVPWGAGSISRVAVGARFASMDAGQDYGIRCASDPVFQALALKHSANWIAGSIEDSMWITV